MQKGLMVQRFLNVRKCLKVRQDLKLRQGLRLWRGPWLLVATAVALLAACSSDDRRETTGPPDSQWVTVTGHVTRKDDQVPVDGGVEIDLRLDDGANERLYFGSLFTYPPPSRERQELYGVLVQVSVGNRVRARGTRSESGSIALEELTILQR